MSRRCFELSVRIRGATVKQSCQADPYETGRPQLAKKSLHGAIPRSFDPDSYNALGLQGRCKKVTSHKIRIQKVQYLPGITRRDHYWTRLRLPVFCLRASSVMPYVVQTGGWPIPKIERPSTRGVRCGQARVFSRVMPSPRS